MLLMLWCRLRPYRLCGAATIRRISVWLGPNGPALLLVSRIFWSWQIGKSFGMVAGFVPSSGAVAAYNAVDSGDSTGIFKDQFS